PSDLHVLTHVDLDHVGEPALSEQAAETPCNDHAYVLAHALERGDVEVVPVCVGDEDGIDGRENVVRDRRRPPEVEDAVAENRVGEDTRAVEVDENRAVPDVGDAVCHGLSMALLSESPAMSEDAGLKIWARGGVPIRSAEGAEYEVLNRFTLCNCSASGNKPFCNGSSRKVGGPPRRRGETRPSGPR